MSQVLESPVQVVIDPEAIGRPYAVVGEFLDADSVTAATRKLYEQGYREMEVMSPFPIHGIDDAMGRPRSILGYIVFCSGACGLTFGFLLQWWTGGVDYPLVIAGKPFFAVESSIPVMFECTILFSAFAAVFGMLFLNGLPRLYHPSMKARWADRATDDRFLLLVEATDSKFNPDQVAKALTAAGALSTEMVEE